VEPPVRSLHREDDRFTVHGFRRTFNNIARQVAGEIVTRSSTGHVTQAMTEHDSHVGREETLAAAGSVVRLVFGRLLTPTLSSPSEEREIRSGDRRNQAIHPGSRDRATPRNQSQCEEEDSNLHSFRNQILSLARLPVPPSSRASRLDIYGFAAAPSTTCVATHWSDNGTKRWPGGCQEHVAPLLSAHEHCAQIFASPVDTRVDVAGHRGWLRR
jgi:hypothetical protein